MLWVSWLTTGDDKGLYFANDCNPSNDGSWRCFNSKNKKQCNHMVDQVSLNHVGQYVVFPARWWHREYYRIQSKKVYYTAQLFCTSAQHVDSWPNWRRTDNKDMKIDELRLDQVCYVSEDIKCNWDMTYSDLKFRTSNAFGGELMNHLSNRHLQDKSFRLVPKMNELVTLFERKYTHLCVKSVTNGGFQDWHRDFFWGRRSLRRLS
jgi:hypothetical protein